MSQALKIATEEMPSLSKLGNPYYNPFYLTAPANPPCFEEFMQFMKCVDVVENKAECHIKLQSLLSCLKKNGATLDELN